MIVGPDRPQLRSELVDAIHQDRLARWADDVWSSEEPDGERRRAAASVRAACQRIREANDDELARLTGALGDAGIATVGSSVSDQRHTVRISVDPDDAERAAAVLRAAGHQSGRAWSRGASVSFRRSADSQVFTRDGDVTSVVQLRWRTRRRGRLRRLFGPTAADWDAVELPTALWWAYSLVRPVRLAAQRLGLRSGDHSALEPFLVTPRSLIEPLLEVATVGSDDVLFDFGCGDGRFIVAAASTRGCRAIGVEQSMELCSSATARAAASGVADRVRVVCGDAAATDLSEITVVVLFLPMAVASHVVADLLGRLTPGARIVLHEQSPLVAGIPSPSAVSAVVVDDAVTVAHRWVVGG